MKSMPPALVDVVDGDDVGVVQGRGSLGLLHEAALALGVGDLLRRQDLDGDEAVQVRVAGLVDHAHPALAELLEDLVVRDGSAGHGPGSFRNSGLKRPS